MKWFKKRPKARIKIGDHFLSDSMSTTAEGYVVYAEWDHEDGRNYYFEEWEFRGFDTFDSWIEYDHYSGKVSRYVPVKVENIPDASELSKGQTASIVVNGQEARGVVTEAADAIAKRTEGTLSYRIFEGDKVRFAEINTDQGVFSIEEYNDDERDVYEKMVLNREAQKKMLGRTVSPRMWKKLLKPQVLITIIILALILVPAAMPQYEVYCTPTSTAYTNTKQEIVSKDEVQTCYKRRVYGGGGSFGK
ncbi:MAG: hypothetical protein R3313_03780 [Candidatus Saccharimonadales bacterium]|nr:hypothetical protein [Candidatus Saccharimonadales bacterium]